MGTAGPALGEVLPALLGVAAAPGPAAFSPG